MTTTRIRLTLDVDLDAYAAHYNVTLDDARDMLVDEARRIQPAHFTDDPTYVLAGSPILPAVTAVHTADIDHQHHTGALTAWAQPGDTCIEVTDPNGDTYTIEATDAAEWAEALTDALYTADIDPKEAAADDAGDPTDDPKDRS